MPLNHAMVNQDRGPGVQGIATPLQLFKTEKNEKGIERS